MPLVAMEPSVEVVEIDTSVPTTLEVALRPLVGSKGNAMRCTRTDLLDAWVLLPREWQAGLEKAGFGPEKPERVKSILAPGETVGELARQLKLDMSDIAEEALLRFIQAADEIAVGSQARRARLTPLQQNAYRRDERTSALSSTPSTSGSLGLPGLQDFVLRANRMPVPPKTRMSRMLNSVTSDRQRAEAERDERHRWRILSRPYFAVRAKLVRRR